MTATRPMSARLEALVVVVAFATLTMVSTYPLVLGLTSHLPNDLGDPVLNAWILAWDAARLRTGLSRVWDAPAFFPYPHALAYSENLFGIAVFTAPIQWMTGNAVLCYNIAFLGSFVLAAGAMYLLARTLAGRRDAAFLAAVIFAFTPYRIAHLAHLQMLMSGWMPLSLWALHRYFSTTRWRYLWAAAGCFLLQSVSNGYFMYFAALPIAIVGLAEIMRRRPPIACTTREVGVVLGALLAALAPIAWAYYTVRQSQGLKRSLTEITLYSADLSDYFRAHHNIWLWRHLGTGWGEHELFPGVVVLALVAALVIAKGQEGQEGRDGQDGRERQVDASEDDADARKTRTVNVLIKDRWTVALYATIAAVAIVLTLGPEPKAWGHRLPFPGPYKWLLAVIPGLDGLRGVARLNIVVVLSLCVVAAFGAMRLLDRLPVRRRPLAIAAATVVVLAESWIAPIPTPFFDPKGDARDRDAYEYLRESPAGGVFEMPNSLENAERELRYQYLTLVHQHPVMNGHSGYQTPLLTFAQSGHSPFNEYDRLAPAIEMLRGVGVRYLVLHPDEFENRDLLEAMLTTIAAERRQIVAERRFARTIVVALAPYDPGPPAVGDSLKRVASSAIHARASHQPGRVNLMFDGNRDSRWLTGDRQTGREWVELELDRPRDVAAVRLQLGERSFGDYPRELAIDVVDEGGTRTLFQGSVLARFARAMVAEGAYPFIDVPLPLNRARTIRLRQLAATHRFFWSIHELQLYER